MRFMSVAALVAATALLAGCGGGSNDNGVAAKSASDILTAAQTAATGAAGVHISGKIDAGGKPVTVDLTLVRGKGGIGRMSESGLGFDIVRIGDKVYIRGSEAFYKAFAGAAAAALLKGKWLEGSATTGQLSSLTALTDLTSFFNGALGSHGAVSKGSQSTVNSQKVIAIKDAKSGGTLYIATTGKPYPIQLESPNGGKEGTVNFDNWDKTVAIVAPKGAIDISKLKG
jgi:hypothetical protein